MKYRTVLFDFDGTLADTKTLSIDVINTLAPEFGYPPVEKIEIPALEKMSARELLVRRAHIPLRNIPKLARFERRGHQEMEKRAAEVTLFAGMPELLRQLRAAGCELGIVTSNSATVVAGALERAGVGVDFVHAGSRFFGKTRAIRDACREYNVDKRYALYIGDELRDLEACKKVGVDFIGVGWGFNSAEALRARGAEVLEKPYALFGRIDTR